MTTPTLLPIIHLYRAMTERHKIILSALAVIESSIHTHAAAQHRAEMEAYYTVFPNERHEPSIYTPHAFQYWAKADTYHIDDEGKYVGLQLKHSDGRGASIIWSAPCLITTDSTDAEIEGVKRGFLIKYEALRKERAHDRRRVVPDYL